MKPVRAVHINVRETIHLRCTDAEAEVRRIDSDRQVHAGLLRRCQAGLVRVYGLHFKAFRPLDAGGPLTKAALDRGDIDLGLIFSSDSAYSTGKYVQLEDDKHLQAADNVVPVGRSKVITSDATSTLNSVSAKLTTDDLIQMNKRSDVDKADPDQIAADWLKSHGFKT